MNIDNIKKEGALIVATVDDVEYVAKTPISLVRLLVRAGMSRIQAAFFYTRIMEA